MKVHASLEELLEDFLNQAEAWGKIELNNMSSSYIRGYTSSNSLASAEPEIWKPVDEFKNDYEVSNKGNVRSIKNNKKNKQTESNCKCSCHLMDYPSDWKAAYCQECKCEFAIT